MISLSSVAIVREIYDNDTPEEAFERDLDKALDIGYELIIIEPTRLGEETARWITVGNYLHKCAVLFGVSSICLSTSWNRNTNTFLIPLSIGSVFCAGLYMISWQFDPCCQYQVASNMESVKIKSLADDRIYHNISDLILAISTCAHPTVLIRKSDTSRKIVHSVIASVALTLAVVRYCF